MGLIIKEIRLLWPCLVHLHTKQRLYNHCGVQAIKRKTITGYNESNEITKTANFFLDLFGPAAYYKF